MNKKLVKAAFIILPVLIISLSAYFVLVKKPPATQEAKVLTLEQNILVKINYSGEWKEVPLQSYHHSVNTMMPATWKFDCCGDTDSFSSLSIFPSSSDNAQEDSSIIITEFVLIKCPENYHNCSSDEALRLSPAQFMINKIKELDTETQLTKKDSIKLANFSTDIGVYNGVSYTENQPFELYLIQTPKGVVKVEFRKSDKFEPSFKTEFLNKLTPN